VDATQRQRNAQRRWPTRPWRTGTQTGETSECLPASVSQMESRHRGVESTRYVGY